MLKCIFHFFPIPYGHAAVLESYGRVTPNKIIFKTGLVMYGTTSTYGRTLIGRDHFISCNPILQYQTSCNVNNLQLAWK